MNKYNAKRLCLDGRTVAYLRGKTCDIRRHANGFLTTPPAIAIAAAILNQLPGDTTIQVTNLDTGAQYFCALGDFNAHSFRVNRIGEVQYALTMDRWAQKIEQNSKALKPGEMRHKPASAPRQHNLVKPPAAKQLMLGL